MHPRKIIMGHTHQKVMLQMEVDPVRRNEDTLPPRSQGCPRIAEFALQVGRHRVLRNRADPHREAIAREPGHDPEQVQERFSRRQKYAK